MDVLIYDCNRCGVAAVTAQKRLAEEILPEGWEDRGDAVLCPDCILSASTNPSNLTGPDEDGDPDLDRPHIPFQNSGLDQKTRPNVERFFAITRPNSSGVTLFFDRGTVELSLAESIAIEDALAGANEIARRQHPVQPGGGK